MKRNKHAPHTVYRHFDKWGKLLYVGCTYSPFLRLQHHVSTSHWSEDIVNVTLERFPSRAEALAAEAKAIKTEQPLHNTEGIKLINRPWKPAKWRTNKALFLAEFNR